MKHTPGPWKLISNWGGDKVYLSAPELPFYIDLGKKEYRSKEMEANHNLMAAAPDLLEALNKIKAGMSSHAIELDKFGVIAAINKAEGES